MPGADWDRLWDVFHRALELPREAREAYLDEATGGDPEMRRELDELLAANDEGATDVAVDRGAQALRRLDPEAMLGRSIGPYRLTDVIGEGGMGVVYAAEQTEPIRRRVALKLIKLGMDSREVVSRFESERQALALMAHPNIARVLDAGASEDGRPYFVMEYVPGLPITEYCDRHRLSLAERIELFVLVCDAVQHAHQKGIIHRDLKPSNVLVTLQDETPQPKIIDFGVAKALTQRLTAKTLYTRFGRFIGTPSYISPEQAEMGMLDIDTRSDIYSLGVLLYELTVGSTPFGEAGGDVPVDIPKLLRERDPPRPSSRLEPSDPDAAKVAELRSTSPERLRRHVRGDLDWIILKALEQDRTRRYASADEFGRDLKRYFADEPVQARPPSTGYRLRKFIARNRLAVVAAGVVVLGTIVGVAGLATGLMQARSAQAVAERERNNARGVAAFLESLLAGASPYVAQGADTELLVDLLEEAAGRIETELGDQHLLAAELHGTIAETYRGLGMLDEAERHARLALAQVEASDAGGESAAALAARADVALVLWARGEMEESLAINEQVLERQIDLLGGRHPETMSTMNNIGIALKGLGRFEEAESLYLDLIERRNEALGATDRKTLITRNNLATLYRDWGRLEDAERWMSAVVADAEAELGPNDPDTIAFTDSMANILVRQGRLDEAEPMHREVVERMRRVNGEEHPDTMGAVYHLGQLYMAKGEYANAERQFRTAYDTVSRSLGADHRYALFSLSWLAKSLMMQERWADAEPLLRRGASVSGRGNPAGSVQTAVFECRLGATLVELGRPEEARPLLERCSPELDRELGADDAVSREARSYLNRLGSG